MADGPVCGGFDTFFGHSKGLYNKFEPTARRSSTQYDTFFSQAIGMTYDFRRRTMLKSDDTGANQIGVKVLESHYSFFLKFYKYDAVSEEHDYPIAKAFSTVYTPTIELIISYPNQIWIS